MKFIIKPSGRKLFVQEVAQFLKNVIATIPGNEEIAVEIAEETAVQIWTLKSDQFHIETEPVLEVYVELSEEARIRALNTKCDLVRDVTDDFFHEAKALRAIAESKPPFSVEIYSLSYIPPTT